MKTNKITSTNNKIFYYNIIDELLVIKTSFNPMQNIKYFENEITKCVDVRFLESIGKCENGTGYVIYSLNKNINVFLICDELEEILKTF